MRICSVAKRMDGGLAEDILECSVDDMPHIEKRDSKTLALPSIVNMNMQARR